MITIRISAEVQENRQVVLTLPPEVPVGTVELVVTVATPSTSANRLPRTSLAEWAEANVEHWGSQLRSTDVESFTGRRF